MRKTANRDTKNRSVRVCRRSPTFFPPLLRTTCRLPLRFLPLLCLQREGTEINPMTPQQPAQMTGQMWGATTAYRPVFSLSSWWDRRVEGENVKHTELDQKPRCYCTPQNTPGARNARPYRCATCPLRGICESGSTGTCCGSSSGFCSCFRTCRTPA